MSPWVAKMSFASFFEAKRARHESSSTPPVVAKKQSVLVKAGRPAAPAATADSAASRELNAELAQLARSKQLSACRKAFRAGCKSGIADCGHTPSSSTHLQLAATATARSSARAMREPPRPCVMSYTAALKAPCARGDLVQARTLLAEMEADAPARKDGGGGGSDDDDDDDDFRGGTQAQGAIAGAGRARPSATTTGSRT